MSATDMAAAALIDEVTAEVQAEAAQAETEAPVAEEAASVPPLEPELPADIQAILEDDPEPEVDEEPEEPVAEYDEPIDVYQDDDGKLRREYEKLKKRAGFQEKQLLKAARPQWQSEIETILPACPREGHRRVSGLQACRVEAGRRVPERRQDRRESGRGSLREGDQRDRGGAHPGGTRGVARAVGQADRRPWHGPGRCG